MWQYPHMASYVDTLINKDVIGNCTPSRMDTIANKILEDTVKGAIAGMATGAVIGSETGPGALATGAIGGVIGTAAGGLTGIVDGIFTPIKPDGACMAKQLLGENIAPLDTPNNPQRPVTPKRIV